MPEIVATPRWLQRNLIIPQVGTVRHPQTGTAIVSDEAADWLIANLYAELAPTDVGTMEEKAPTENELLRVKEASSAEQVTPNENTSPEDVAIQWLNSASLESIAEIKGITTQVAQSLVESRPLTWDSLQHQLTDRQLASVKKNFNLS